MGKRALMIGALIALAGCGQTWVKPGATDQDYATDSYACEKDARQSGYFGTGLVGSLNMQSFFDRCMAAHGWRPQQSAASSSPSPATPSERQVMCRLSQQPPVYEYTLEGKCAAKGGVPESN